MHKQSGNFLLQALLALSLIIAFMPFFAKKLALRNTNAQMYVTTTQLETAQTAAKIYIRENENNLNYGKFNISGDDFSDILEPYGLPLGFLPRTVFGQNISLIMDNNENDMKAYLEVSDGKMTKIQRKELIRRIGFYASESDNKIIIEIPKEEDFSDLVQINNQNSDNSGFLSDMDMDNFDIKNIKNIYGRNGDFESYQSNAIYIFGTESGKKAKNSIENVNCEKSVFQSVSGESALSLTRGKLTTENLSAKTISKFGNTGKFLGGSAGVSDFSMTAGSASFYGPADWQVKKNVITNNISFTVENLEIDSFINATRGQDVYIDSDSLEYTTSSGITTGIIRTENITLRDQTSDALSDGKTGAVILDIRPAGNSILPDALISGINNDSFKIIADPSDADGKTITCKSLITDLDGNYNSKSIAQNIICQYVFWERLEKRINIKKCLSEGKSDCE